MSSRLKPLTDYLVSLGTDDVPHSGDSAFLAHLIGVYRDLERWRCDQAVCEAGLFHSIYGTEKFKRFSLPLERRGEVQALIGERAERLAYLNCAMDRPSFDATVVRNDGRLHMVDRYTSQEIELLPADYDDLCWIQVCDWVEQVERLGEWDYRREAYRQMADRLGGVAKQEYDRVFAAEPV
jgi:hypothetical protein